LTFDARDLDKSQPEMDCGTHIITGGIKCITKATPAGEPASRITRHGRSGEPSLSRGISRWHVMLCGMPAPIIGVKIHGNTQGYAKP